MSLTNKQIAFCEEYLIDLNGAQAAIRAGYSSDSAKEIASQNLTKPDIQAYIQELQSARSERTKITADKVLRELARIGFADTRSLFSETEEGLSLKPLKELSEDDAAMIGGIKFGKYGVEITVVDKIAALDRLGKHLKLFTEVNENLNIHSFQKMGRIKAETIEGSQSQVKSVSLTFDIGEPVDSNNDEDEE